MFRRRKRLPLGDDGLGDEGEAIAVQALKRAGYKILERNAELGRFEIDIIAREGGCIAFVEVKTRRTSEAIRPEDNVNRRKQLHIAKAADIWKQKHDYEKTRFRYDIVAIVMPEGGKAEIQIFRDAFRV